MLFLEIILLGLTIYLIVSVLKGRAIPKSAHIMASLVALALIVWVVIDHKFTSFEIYLLILIIIMEFIFIYISKNKKG